MICYKIDGLMPRIKNSATCVEYKKCVTKKIENSEQVSSGTPASNIYELQK